MANRPPFATNAQLPRASHRAVESRPRLPKANHGQQSPRVLSAACAKSRHSECYRLNCPCGCHNKLRGEGAAG